MESCVAAGERRGSPAAALVVGVYDGQKMYLYIDGALDVSQDGSGPINPNDWNVQIGANEEKPDRFFDGLIDDVRVYNHGISAAEVAALAGK